MIRSTKGLVLACLIPSVAWSQAPADASLQVDGIFAPWTGVTGPGCAVAVAEDGLTVLSRAYGMADLEHGVPNAPTTVFEGGSVSKQFTAAAVVLLALDGKLSLDDDVRRYVPEVPDYGVRITLHHLMTHTSGLRDWGSVAGIAGWGRENRSHDHDHVLDIVSRQSALNFPPGHEYSYSNTGYNLLAVVVDRVGGTSFADFSRRRIFEPLGLTSTQWRDDYRRIVPARSTAYSTTEGGWRINRPIEFVHGNGGILTTVGDLTLWNQALAEGRLGGPDFVRLMHQRGLLSNGTEITYAGGLQHGALGTVRSVTHTGSTAGYRAFLGRYPERGLSVAMLCNASNVPTGGTGARIARVWLGEDAVDAAGPPGVSVPERDIQRLAGLYRDPVTGNPLRLVARGSELRIAGRSAPLTALSPTEFAAGARRYVIADTTGARPVVRLESWQYTDQRYEAVDEPDPAADLTVYEGVYHSPDAETTYRVEARNGRLVTWQRPGRERTYEALYPDAFRSGGYLIRFRRDESGGVTSLSLRLGRV